MRNIQNAISRLVFVVMIIHLVTATTCFAQHTEYSVIVSSGLSHFATKSIGEPYYSMINIDYIHQQLKKTYDNYPFGEKNGFSYQFMIGLKRVTRHRNLWGIDFGYQSFQSKKNLHWALYANDYKDTIYPADGKCSLRNNYLALNPYFGHRFVLGRSCLDITGGVNLETGVFPAHEMGSAVITSLDQRFSCDIRSKDGGGQIAFEISAKLQALWKLKKWGVGLNYLYGFNQGDQVVIGGNLSTSYLRCISVLLSRTFN